MEYYAKSENPQGHQETVKEHLQKVAALAREYGEVLGLEEPAELEGQIHDFGKYTESFQDVLKGTRTGVDHAIGGACFLECCYRCESIVETEKKMTKGARREIVRCEQTDRTLLRDLPSQ